MLAFGSVFTVHNHKINDCVGALLVDTASHANNYDRYKKPVLCLLGITYRSEQCKIVVI